MLRRFTGLLLLVLLVTTPSLVTGQASWPQFRGPGGSGIAGGDASLPVELGPDRNCLWHSEIPFGLSSPVIWGAQIFLTGVEGTKLEVLAIDRGSGKLLWRRSAWYEFIERVHRTNSPATPTPVTDGKRVYVYLGSSGLLCYDLEGNEVWSRIIRIPPNLYGTASSLILAGERLIFCNDTDKGSYLEAIDPATGKTVWKTDRKDLKYNWTTPMHWSNNGVDEIVVNGQSVMKAYALADGAERWHLPGLTDEPIVTPVAAPNGLIYVTSYNMKTNTEVIGLPAWKELLATLDSDGDGQLTFAECKPNRSILSRADADGEGDHPLWGFHRWLDADTDGKVTEEEWQKIVQWVDSFPQENALLAVRPGRDGGPAEIVWKHEKGVPECPSPLYYDGLVYLVKNGGMMTCLDGGSGELKYQERLGAGGPYYASPVAGDGKVYTASARGMIVVLAAGPRLKVLARNELDERISATPAIAEGKIYVRTDKQLFAFGTEDRLQPKHAADSRTEHKGGTS
jgi:outer membrane protein assembly factor BamB